MEIIFFNEYVDDLKWHFTTFGCKMEFDWNPVGT